MFRSTSSIRWLGILQPRLLLATEMSSDKSFFYYVVSMK